LFAARSIVVGRDVRLSIEKLVQALVRGLTDMVYFGAAHLDVDGGIMVTASHNPMDYNGMKLVGKGARPISGDSGLRASEDIVVAGDFPMESCEGIAKGVYKPYDIMKEYTQHLLNDVDVAKMKW